MPYDSRTNDFNLGAEWTNGRNMLRVGYTGSWFDNLDDTLIWDSPLQLTDTTSAPGRGCTALWPSNSAQTISAAGYTKLGEAHATDRVHLFWFLEQRRAAASVHHQCGTARARPAQDYRTGRRARVFDQPELRLAAAGQLELRRAGAPLRLQQPNPARRHPRLRRLRHLAQPVDNRGSGTLRSQSNDIRCRRNVDRAPATGLDRRLYPQRQRLRLPRLPRDIGKRAAPHGRRGGEPVGLIPGPVSSRGSHRLGPERRSAGSDRRAAGHAPLRPGQPQPEPIHRAGGCDAQ